MTLRSDCPYRGVKLFSSAPWRLLPFLPSLKRFPASVLRFACFINISINRHASIRCRYVTSPALEAFMLSRGRCYLRDNCCSFSFLSLLASEDGETEIRMLNRESAKRPPRARRDKCIPVSRAIAANSTRLPHARARARALSDACNDMIYKSAFLPRARDISRN